MLQKKVFIGFIICFTLFGCNKNTYTAKKLSGEWRITYYKLTHPDNWVEYGSALNGSVIFKNEKKSSSGGFNLDIAYALSGKTASQLVNGAFETTTKGEYLTVSTYDSITNTPTKLSYRILTLTQTDLQLEIRNTKNYLHNFLFKKVE